MSVKPELVLFISIDLTGSTAFKNAKNASTADSSKEPLPWLSAFLLFYKGFPDVFFQKFNTSEKERRPRFWKHIGDELLFYVPLKDNTHCVDVMIYLLQAIQEYINSGDLRKNNLGLKCTAWTAGFPVNNFKFTVPDSNGIPKPSTHDKDYPIDFIGPDIDLGFRLTKYSSAQRCIISADLTYLLLNAPSTDSFKWHYSGRQELKGFHSRGGYPVIWLESDLDSIDRLEVDLDFLPKISDLPKLKQLCEIFLSDRPFMPFIPIEGHYPDGYCEYLEKALGFLERDLETEMTEEDEIEFSGECTDESSPNT